MDKNDEFDRVNELYLRNESPRYIGSSSQPAIPSSVQAYDHPEQRTRPPLSSPTYSSRSSVSRSSISSSRHCRSDTSGSVQSSNSSFSSEVPPWELLTLNQALTSVPFNYGYDLPCEFTFVGCNLRFYPGDFEAWIGHSISHFREHGPPVRTVCTFCDHEFYDQTNPKRSWTQRMVHIGGHFFDLRRFDGVDLNHRRPCFWTLEHLNSCGFISPEDYSAAIGYSERPTCDNTHAHGWKPQEMLAKEERKSCTNHDLRKEKRQRRKEKDKRTGKTRRHHS